MGNGSDLRSRIILSSFVTALVILAPLAAQQSSRATGGTASSEQLARLRTATALPLDKAPIEARVVQDGRLTKVSTLSFLLVPDADPWTLEELQKVIAQQPQLSHSPAQLLAKLGAGTPDGTVVVGQTSCTGTCTNNCGVLGCDAHKLSDGSIYCTPCNCVQDGNNPPACSTCTCAKTSVITQNGVTYMKLPSDWSFSVRQDNSPSSGQPQQ